MKGRYWLVIILLILVGVWVGYKILYTPLGENVRLDKMIQITGVLVALLTAVIALAVADPRQKKVNINIEHYIDNKEEYPKAKLAENLQKDYKDYADPIVSYRVQFKMINISGFSLKKPTLAFRLPSERRHPNQPLNSIDVSAKSWSIRSFNSNIYNSQSELRVLEFGDTVILSNSNLPYWNNQDELILWIRMVLNDKNLEPFNVAVYVNCENADGTTKNVLIDPKKLLNIV